MAGELKAGLRTLIEHDGREFELPERHTIDVYAGRHGPDSYVCLGARTGGSSLFAVSAIEERDDAIVVRLGSLMGTSGPAGFGNYVPEPTGYPFPEGSA